MLVGLLFVYCWVYCYSLIVLLVYYLRLRGLCCVLRLLLAFCLFGFWIGLNLLFRVFDIVVCLVCLRRCCVRVVCWFICWVWVSLF